MSYTTQVSWPESRELGLHPLPAIDQEPPQSGCEGVLTPGSLHVPAKWLLQAGGQFFKGVISAGRWKESKAKPVEGHIVMAKGTLGGSEWGTNWTHCR